MKKTIWLSYDLGIIGDYEGIYAWLDKHKAVECGDSIAWLEYEFTDDLLETLKKDIEDSVDLYKITGRIKHKASKNRIYVIWYDDEEGKMKGRFIFGTRKFAPWSGYHVGESEIEDTGT